MLYLELFSQSLKWMKKKNTKNYEKKMKQKNEKKMDVETAFEMIVNVNKLLTIVKWNEQFNILVVGPTHTHTHKNQLLSICIV